MRLMRTIAIALGTLALLVASLGAADASASFGLKPGSVDATVFDAGGHTFSQAGGHAATVGTVFNLNTMLSPIPEQAELGLQVSSESPLREVTVEAPAGFIGNPTATPRCSLVDFLGTGGDISENVSTCPPSTIVGTAVTTLVYIDNKIKHWHSAIYNLKPHTGQPALFAFRVASVPTFVVPSIRSEGDYGIDFNVINIDRTLPITASRFTLWGNPMSESHDFERLDQSDLVNWCAGGKKEPPCPSDAAPKAFLTNPVDCYRGPYLLRNEVKAWAGQTDSAQFVTHDDEGNPLGVTRCDRVPFEPSMSSLLSTDSAESPSGLDFELTMPTAGLENPEGIAQSYIKEAVVSLPEGVTLNPSAGEGLGACTKADFAREQFDTPAGAGCPNSSKIGTVDIESPLLEPGEKVDGALYVATPDDRASTDPQQENPFDSLLALYLVAKVPERGVIVKLAGRVEPDPQTGRLTTTFEDLPQLPFSSFRLHFREGGRAPLVSAPSCGSHATEATLYPYSDPTQPVHLRSESLISKGVGGGSCPANGLPPFRPALRAGSVNNAAGAFTPFDAFLSRTDAEQEITHFSIKLPPGLVGKLAGVPFCPNRAIALAKSREFPGGGHEEQILPSCPISSLIGRTLVGAGVGSVLTYVPGKVYLAGRYHGDPLSIVAITSGVVGPFDIGTVVVREALKVDPETGEVFIDATGSDPIPHIVDGITTHIRDLRTYVDRPEFTLNPTDCSPTSTSSTVLGSGLDFASPADDNPFVATSPFQAADCAALPFKPRLTLSLNGQTKRAGNPALHAHLAMHGIGESGLAFAQVSLPKTLFLDNAHINTICTRVQFKAGDVEGEQCPPGSVIGHAKALTPILSEPLEGPIYLKANPERELPDIAAALHGEEISVIAVGHTDSAPGGGLRNTFEVVPDAPITSVDIDLFGANKGLIESSRNLCSYKPRAKVVFRGQNGRSSQPVVPLRASGCPSHKQHKRHRARR